MKVFFWFLFFVSSFVFRLGTHRRSGSALHSNGHSVRPLSDLTDIFPFSSSLKKKRNNKHMRQPFVAENIRSSHCIISNDVSLPMQGNKIQCDRRSQHLDSHSIQFSAPLMCISCLPLLWWKCVHCSVPMLVCRALCRIYSLHTLLSLVDLHLRSQWHLPHIFLFFCISLLRHSVICQPPLSSITHFSSIRFTCA